MLAVGATARHSMIYWTAKYGKKKPSHISRYVGRDFTAMWTVGVVAMWVPGIGVGAAIASGAVASILTDA
jgi:hypothetical protein